MLKINWVEKSLPVSSCMQRSIVKVVDSGKLLGGQRGLKDIQTLVISLLSLGVQETVRAVLVSSAELVGHTEVPEREPRGTPNTRCPLTKYPHTRKVPALCP